ncbi:MAG: hypothetical protein ACOWWO_10905 [Peptococcaceae bacterium]
MYIYCERILLQILAFSLGPLLGLVITAFTNYYLGIIGGIVGFISVFWQPWLSDLCLKNTAHALKLGRIILGEGKVRYYSRENCICQGKLFLSRDTITFVVNNRIDVVLPLVYINSAAIKQPDLTQADTVDMDTVFVRKPPNLSQVVTMVSALAAVSPGALKIEVKHSTFTNYFYFEVSNPKLWLQKINEMKENRK